MALEWSSESYFKKEMAKWDRSKRDGGYNRNGYEKYPQMLYKTMLDPISGKHEVALQRDYVSADKTVVVLSAEQFNASCQMVVNNDDELARAKADGWRETQKEAVEYHSGAEQEKAVEAAVRAYSERNMSDSAKAEVKAIEGTSAEHMPEIPEQPKKRPTAAQLAGWARAAEKRKRKATSSV